MTEAENKGGPLFGIYSEDLLLKLLGGEKARKRQRKIVGIRNGRKGGKELIRGAPGNIRWGRKRKGVLDCVKGYWRKSCTRNTLI